MSTLKILYNIREHYCEFTTEIRKTLIAEFNEGIEEHAGKIQVSYALNMEKHRLRESLLLEEVKEMKEMIDQREQAGGQSQHEIRERKETPVWKMSRNTIQTVHNIRPAFRASESNCQRFRRNSEPKENNNVTFLDQILLAEMD